MKTLVHPNDPWKMNWIEGTHEWGTVFCRPGIECQYKSRNEENIIREIYTFTNTTEDCIQTKLTDISICTPFNDNYESATECLVRRCHTHIFYL